jgi:hypothetical protein
MTDCGYCLYNDGDDLMECEVCPVPEFTEDMYRDTCDICHEFIMIPYSTRDNVNLVVCKKCSHEPYEDMDAPIGTYEGVFVEGGREWWK